MTEPQFAYSTLTLDELRSLAASPQVGTIEAMPQSFRALADRVSEVADLLSHAQADLPSWCKGPAAEQAAATLGRAAAEAREFHDSAMGAATAVSRCAQVVAAQQNQMMNVPDVQEPGVTDVVQRPTTPFEALEAARQDTKYQAAHEQAVQVVNGIAAQYVETRSQLSNIGVKFGENFIPVEKMPPATPKVPYGSNSQSAPSAMSDLYFIESRQPSKDGANSRNAIPAEDRPTLTRKPHYSPFKSAPKSNLDPVSNSAPPDTTTHNLSEYATNGHAAIAVDPLAPPKYGETAPNIKEFSRANNSLQTSPEDEAQTEGTTDHKRYQSKNPSLIDLVSQTGRVEDMGSGSSIDEIGHPSGMAENNILPPTSQSTYQSQPGQAGDESAAIIPPYSSLGSVHRSRNEHNPRPGYLKERKSAWLPDTVAAPADGVLGPDWYEHR